MMITKCSCKVYIPINHNFYVSYFEKTHFLDKAAHENTLTIYNNVSQIKGAEFRYESEVVASNKLHMLIRTIISLHTNASIWTLLKIAIVFR